MKLKYFGTDGIRGKVGSPAMDVKFIKKFAIALARYLRMRHPKGEIHTVLGRDTRESGKEFEKILIENMLPYGICMDVIGIAPTPAIAYWVDELEADHGIMLTASHNPASDNGIKLFNAHGIKQTLDKELLIEPLIDETDIPPIPGDLKMGEIIFHEKAISGYIDNINFLPKNSLKNWKIIVDCANGATTEAAKMLFKQLGADALFINNQPNGSNINQACGSESPESMIEQVKATGARLGVAYDGDGDRVRVCDENGELVYGDQLLGILALHAIETGTLNDNILVATVQSNFGLDKAIKTAGGNVIRAQVGDRNVFESMQEHNASLGGESSGHIIFPEFEETGDGLLSTLKLIEVMKDTQKPLSELKKQITLQPESFISLKVSQKKKLQDLPSLQATQAWFDENHAKDYYALIRFSGTENKLRLLIQGPDSSVIETILNKFIEAAKQDLDVLDA